MKKTRIILILLTLFLIITIGFVKIFKFPNNIQNTKSENPNNQITQSSTNIVIEPNTDAAKVPFEYYEYINKKEYEKAIKLLGPTLAFQGDPSMRKYLENLQQVTINNFKDISDYPGYLDPVKQKYYAIKIYYADLDIKVKDKNLVPFLNQPQHRKFYVIKETKDSPWLLDGDEATDLIK